MKMQFKNVMSDGTVCFRDTSDDDYHKKYFVVLSYPLEFGISRQMDKDVENLFFDPIKQFYPDAVIEDVGSGAGFGYRDLEFEVDKVDLDTLGWLALDFHDTFPNVNNQETIGIDVAISRTDIDKLLWSSTI